MKRNIIKCSIILIVILFASSCSMNERSVAKDEVPNQEDVQVKVINVSNMLDLVATPDEIQLLGEGKVIDTLTKPQEINDYMEKLSKLFPDIIGEYKSVYSPEKVIIKLVYHDTKAVKIVGVEDLEGRILKFNTIDIDSEGLVFLQLDNDKGYYMSIAEIEDISSLPPSSE